MNSISFDKLLDDVKNLDKVIVVMLDELEDTSSYGVIDGNNGGIRPKYKSFDIEILDDTQIILLKLTHTDDKMITLKEIQETLDKSGKENIYEYVFAYLDEKNSLEYVNSYEIFGDDIILKSS